MPVVVVVAHRSADSVVRLHSSKGVRRGAKRAVPVIEVEVVAQRLLELRLADAQGFGLREVDVEIAVSVGIQQRGPGSLLLDEIVHPAAAVPLNQGESGRFRYVAELWGEDGCI